MAVTDFSAFAEIHASLPTHRKTYALARVLSQKRVTVVGMLVCLWLWALEDGTGVLQPDALMLADVMQWDGDPKLLLDALLATGWLEQREDGQWSIHAWSDYTGELQLKRAERMRQNREAQQRRRQKLADLQPSLRGDSVELGTRAIQLRTPPDHITPLSGRFISENAPFLPQSGRPALSALQPDTHNVSMTSALLQHDVSALSSYNRTEPKRTEKKENTGPGPSTTFLAFLPAFEQLNARACTPAEAEKLFDLEKEHGTQHLLAAFNEARDNNARSLRYIETILESWRANGYEKKVKPGGRQNGRTSENWGTITATKNAKRSPTTAELKASVGRPIN